MAASWNDKDAETGNWRNWASNQHACPRQFASPRNVASLTSCIRSAATPIRPVGSGHSFTALVPSDGTLLDLSGLAEADRLEVDGQSAWISANARLSELSASLARRTLAFRNLGDVDVQSFAGAAATGTHGTGKDLPALHAEIEAIRLMDAHGEIVEANRENDPDLLRAAQVGLGVMGVMLDAKVRLAPSFRLHRRTWPLPLGETLRTAHSQWDTHRNFEFFYIPFSGQAICVSHDETSAPAEDRDPRDDDAAVILLKRARDLTGWWPALRRFLLSRAIRAEGTESTVGTSYKLLANPRGVPFTEMEYHLPPDAALDVVRDVIRIIERERRDVFFPVEVRQTAGDDAMLSPFGGGPRISVAVHALAGEDNDFFFTRLEPIFRAAGGRPHWGKLHSLQAGALEDLYPEFESFRQQRRRIDPDGRFLSPYLASLLGEAA